MQDRDRTFWIVCGLGGGDAPPVRSARALASAEAACAEGLMVLDNLSRRAVEGRASLPPVLFGNAPLAVVAVRPRAVRALFEFASVPLRGRDVRWIAASAEAGGDAPSADPREGQALPDAADWIPWYPVIDAARCVRCGQCVKFCLFGVYESAPDGFPVVVRPEKCKNRCPACARICPRTAIIFPRYEESPFNGDEVVDGPEREAALRGDLQRILGDDPIAALRARQERARARRLVDPAKLEAALAERERHLRADGRGGEA